MNAAVDPMGDPHREKAPSDPAEGALRASDAERNEVVELLGEHASAGRLTLAELEERVQRAYAARTRAELAALTEDLPALSTISRRGKVRRWSPDLGGPRAVGGCASRAPQTSSPSWEATTSTYGKPRSTATS